LRLNVYSLSLKEKFKTNFNEVMPRGPKGERRPRDVIGQRCPRIATGQITDDVPPPEDEGRDPAAVALGRKGVKARAECKRHEASGDRA
jgi:hypothetical protein